MTFSSFIAAAASFAVIGFVLSLVIEYTKRFLAASGHRMLYALLISVAGGLAIYFSGLIPESFYQIALQVIGSVNTMYLLLVQWIPMNPPASTQTAQPAAPQPTAAV